MRRMFSKKQIEVMIPKALENTDISTKGITSKGIANTGGLANIGDVAISGNLDVSGEGKGIITANKISQRIPNWELDIKSLLNTDFFKDTSKLYAKFVLLGNELSLVISGQFVAKADTNNYHLIFNANNLEIPEDISNKIYRADGSTLNRPLIEGSTFAPYITAFTSTKANPSIASCTALLQSGLANNLSVYVYNFGATTEDALCYIDLRVQLTII